MCDGEHTNLSAAKEHEKRKPKKKNLITYNRATFTDITLLAYPFKQFCCCYHFRVSAILKEIFVFFAQDTSIEYTRYRYTYSNTSTLPIHKYL